MDIAKVWFEKETSLLVAYETIDNYFDFNEDALIPRNVISKISRKPVKTPKIKANDEIADEYHRVKSLGFDLDIPKFETYISNVSEDVDVEKFSIDDLQNLLDIALESEDYESAAELRDAINELKKNKKS
jgi:excinuclease UvrABC helicase subunit UvrB